MRIEKEIRETCYGFAENVCVPVCSVSPVVPSTSGSLLPQASATMTAQSASVIVSSFFIIFLCEISNLLCLTVGIGGLGSMDGCTVINVGTRAEFFDEADTATHTTALVGAELEVLQHLLALLCLLLGGLALGQSCVAQVLASHW